MITVTGATGKLGHLTIKELIKTIPASQIVAIGRHLDKADDLKALGVQVRLGDYDKPETLTSALKDVDKLLLISSSEIGKREAHHKTVIQAAVAAKIKHLVYTSILRADTSRLLFAKEHIVTEKAIQESGLTFTILRNGWYLENHTENLGSALQYGVIMGAAKDGRFASASREDYAKAAAKVLTSAGHENKFYELSGNISFTLKELAAEVSKQSAKQIVYKDMPAAEYEKALVGFGLPQIFANALADSDVGASLGDLDVKSNDLSKLIGTETTTLTKAVATALNK